VVAIALELAGKGNVPLALRVAEKIRSVTKFLHDILKYIHLLTHARRYPRATIIQREGSHLYQAKFKPDWNSVAKDPSMLAPPSDAWLFQHDCQAYVYANFNAIVEAIDSGQEFTPSNVPLGDAYTG
jgi:hypothetical protein